jgi:arylsulfatase A-like enzyme
LSSSHTLPSPITSTNEPQIDAQKMTLLTPLWQYALLGATAALVLSLIELVDLQIQLAPVFASIRERLTLVAYASLNVMVGGIIGLLVGLFVCAATFLKDKIALLISRDDRSSKWPGLVAGVVVFILAAILLKQQPQIHGYLIELIREAEKIDQLRDTLLNHERSTSYALQLAILLSCWMLWKIARAISKVNRVLQVAFFLLVSALIAVAYSIDSRVEVQLYDPSLHRSLFVTNFALMMALVGTIWFLSPRLQSLRLNRAVVILLLIFLFLGAGFTILNFDTNQNLKNQVFFRTTQTRQHVRLAQWALDLDRDGWSALLGGGDADDFNPNINPYQKEVIGDSVDNNCLGGDLTAQDLEGWHRQFQEAQRPPDANARRLNVVYVFIDAIRADHLGTYGYHRNTSPNMDRLAAKAQVFENGFTPAPNTFEALPKFTQGTYWDAHVKGWPQILAENGYNAMVFPRRLPTLLRHVKGMRVVNEAKVRKFEETIDVAIKVFSEQPEGKPFAAYLYATDTHRPYKTHEQFNYGETLVDLYDGEIAYMDAHLGRLFDWMERAGRLNDTMIVIMADHAESLGERGVYKHSSQLYNEQLHIPYIIYVPNLAPRRIPDYVSSVDLSPTILNIVGLAYPEECAGVSLLPMMKGETFSHPPVYAEQRYGYQSYYVRPDQTVHPDSKKYMVLTQDGYKLIYNRNAYSFELFNLKTDPEEERNLYDYERARAEEMKKLLGRYVDVLQVSRPWDADETQYIYGHDPYKDVVK